LPQLHRVGILVFVTPDEIARRLEAQAITDAAELAADIWESNEELDAVLADLRASRNASLR
jgi:hypothetical protein